TADGAARDLPGKGAFHAPAGSLIEMITPGPGGFGPPGERDRTAVGRDLRDGYVSAAPAQRDYGIADPQTLRDAPEDLAWATFQTPSRAPTRAAPCSSRP